MANTYTNYKAILTTSELTTLYTVDSSSVSYTLETNRNIQKGTSEELFNSYSFSTSPVVLKESEALKLQAENGGDLHIILSVLEIS